MNSRYYLTFKSTFQSEKPKKLEITSLNVKFLIGIICILLHWWKKVTLVHNLANTQIFPWSKSSVMQGLSTGKSFFFFLLLPRGSLWHFFCHVFQNWSIFQSFLFLCFYANFCKSGVHSYQLYCVQTSKYPQSNFEIPGSLRSLSWGLIIIVLLCSAV